MTDKICSLEGCERPHKAKNYCKVHYSKYIGKYSERTTQNQISYWGMRARCYSKSNPAYPHYGARGIKVCERWLGREGYKNFCIDMGDRPNKSYTLDRIDVNGPYNPSNCRWASKETQSINRRKQQNNSTGKTGVYWKQEKQCWLAVISFNKQRKHLGYFNEFSEAVKARRNAELSLFGFNNMI